MAHETIIAARYARGLAECARERDELAAVRGDIEALADLLDPVRGAQAASEILDFLHSPVMPEKAKLEFAGAVLEKLGTGKTVADFLKVVITRGRIDLFPAISREYGRIAAEMTGERSAAVFTARPLTPDQLDRLEAALAQSAGGTVRIVQRVSPELVAGVRIELGGKELDFSISGRLERLRRKLTEA